jgi:lysophospholipase L1-like esterase
MKHTITLTTLALALLAAACSEEPVPVGAYSAGALDPSVFVTVGTSVSAGFSDGISREDYQYWSFGAQLARSFQTTGVGSPAFVQPLMPAPGTGQELVLISLYPALQLQQQATTITVPANFTHPAPYNNLGIYGAIMYDAIDTSSASQRATDRQNPFYPFILRNQAALGKSMLDQAIALQPTLMTFELGANDVLGYVTSGGTAGTDPTFKLPTPASTFGSIFELSLLKIATALPETEVLIANVPDPTVLPFVTTVPSKVPNPGDPSQLLSIYFRKNDGSVAAVGDGDYVLLTAQTPLKGGIGFSPSAPLDSRYVLDAGELAVAQKAVADYNAIIATEIAKYPKFRLVDFNATLLDVKANGYHVAGETYTMDFISGGIISLDGVHPTRRGAAIFANMFIDVMNREFHANIPHLALSNIPGVKAPLQKTGTKAPWTIDIQLPSMTINGRPPLF